MFELSANFIFPFYLFEVMHNYYYELWVCFQAISTYFIKQVFYLFLFKYFELILNPIIYSLQIFFSNIFIFLLLTIVIATVTLIERKVLALVQRRVGPNYIGYKGRLQFIADALKLLLKHITIFSFTNRLIFLISPALVLIMCYLF